MALLTVSAGGVAAVRPSAQRWYRAAPAADATWEFSPSYEADPDALSGSLKIAGKLLELSEATFRVDPVEEELRIHIGVHHPVFRHMPHDAQMQVSYLLLDWLVGEDDVERWLGHSEALPDRPTSAQSGEDLRAAIRAIAVRRDPHEWVLAQWTDRDGFSGLASFRRGLRWVDHPTFDRHQVVTVGYTAQHNGLPADTSVLDTLQALEFQLEQILASRGILIGYESHRGARVFHAYTDSEDQNVDDAVRLWAKSAGISVSASADPAWTEVRHLAG